MADVDFSALYGGTVVITNNTERDLNIQLYRVNLWTPVPAGDTLTLTVTSSEEAAYYTGLAEGSKGIMFPKMDGTPAYFNETGLISVAYTAKPAPEENGNG